MAIDRGDKENVPPPSAAAARRCVVAVRKCKLKRLGMARRRLPLRDITNLFLASADPAPATADWDDLQRQPQPHEGSSEHAEAVMKSELAPLAASASALAQSWPSSGVALKPGRYSLRKEFR
ncbi:hypothetical protein ABZP36_021068 [Zizania latifolia]